MREINFWSLSFGEAYGDIGCITFNRMSVCFVLLFLLNAESVLHEVYQVYAMWWDSSVLRLISGDSASYVYKYIYIYRQSMTSVIGTWLVESVSWVPRLAVW